MIDLQAVAAIVAAFDKLKLNSGEVVSARCLLKEHDLCVDIPECSCKHHKVTVKEEPNDEILPYGPEHRKRRESPHRVGRKKHLDRNAPSGDLPGGLT